ncbi:MAG: hypothetical protein KKA79_10740 [Nanoarchaeota archaeon]|nr:hypothetical protein [Nanoarchaeota archaeon]MCG2717428.1 hypothetical protein [Nanoarchaeota archaeon]
MKLPKSFRKEKEGKIEQLVEKAQKIDKKDPFSMPPEKIYSIVYDLAYKRGEGLKSSVENIWGYEYFSEDNIFRAAYYLEYGEDGNTITWSALELNYNSKRVFEYHRNQIITHKPGFWEEELLQVYKKEEFECETA